MSKATLWQNIFIDLYFIGLYEYLVEGVFVPVGLNVLLVSTGPFSINPFFCQGEAQQPERGQAEEKSTHRSSRTGGSPNKKEHSERRNSERLD